MKKTVWKYELRLKDVNVLEMPKDAEILSLQTQKGDPCFWALVNPEAEKEVRKFGMIGTGHFIKQDNLDYIGTFQNFSETLVFHVFEIFPTK